jgi:hypothetical protein
VDDEGRVGSDTELNVIRRVGKRMNVVIEACSPPFISSITPNRTSDLAAPNPFSR